MLHTTTRSLSYGTIDTASYYQLRPETPIEKEQGEIMANKQCSHYEEFPIV
jgi:hypothetical protein